MARAQTRAQVDRLTRQAGRKLQAAVAVRQGMPPRTRPLARWRAWRQYHGLLAEAQALTDRAAALR